MKSTAVGNISIYELERLIERKVWEVLGDPDLGLRLRKDFKRELRARLSRSSETVSHNEIVRRYGKHRLFENYRYFGRLPRPRGMRQPFSASRVAPKPA